MESTSLVFAEHSPFAPTDIVALPGHVRVGAEVVDMVYKQREALSR
jgi:hypothetical protein